MRIYDLVMTHKLDADDYFIHCVQQQCAAARLNFFLVEPLWVELFYESLQTGRLWPRVLLNMHSEHHQPQDIFHRLVRLAAERNTQVIDPLDRALAAFDKGRLHPRLVAAGIPVPFTVVVPNEQAASFELSEADRAALGAPFVIKPSMGYGRRGVVMDATSESELASSVAGWPDGNYLFQRRISPRDLEGSPAYFRVYYVFGSTWCAWWNPRQRQLSLVTAEEMTHFSLAPLCETIQKIATLTGMSFFSTEIAQTESGEFVVIDYVNDQCHMLSQTANPSIGVPDALVAALPDDWSKRPKR